MVSLLLSKSLLGAEGQGRWAQRGADAGLAGAVAPALLFRPWTVEGLLGDRENLPASPGAFTSKPARRSRTALAEIAARLP